MAHQTGITASEELRQVFASSNDGNTRLIKVSIEEEKLVLATSFSPKASWEEDYDEFVVGCLEENQPCYILFRLDDKKDGAGYQWIYIYYSPEYSSARPKLLYAATKATLKAEFGADKIKDDLFGTEVCDVSLAGYRKHLQEKKKPKPLTAAEEAKKLIKEQEQLTLENMPSKQSYLSGLKFPVDDDAYHALTELRDGAFSFVQLKMKKEKVVLAMKDNVEVNALAQQIPNDEARYNFFVFKHTHEEDYQEAVGKIYTRGRSSGGYR